MLCKFGVDSLRFSTRVQVVFNFFFECLRQLNTICFFHVFPLVLRLCWIVPSGFGGSCCFLNVLRFVYVASERFNVFFG